jgi:hypothetical protein
MSDDRTSQVLGALPRTRPHRRSQKRPSRPADEAVAAQPTATQPEAPPQPQAPTRPKRPAPLGRPARPKRPARPQAPTRPQAKTRAVPKAERLAQPAQPTGTPPAPRTCQPMPASGTDILGTAVQAAAELAEIGLSVSARAIRGAVSRLPRP